MLKNKGLKPILVDFFYKKESKKMPIIIFCHGYKGFKDWGAWNLVGEEFANKNFFFIKFNFSHNRDHFGLKDVKRRIIEHIACNIFHKTWWK